MFRDILGYSGMFQNIRCSWFYGQPTVKNRLVYRLVYNSSCFSPPLGLFGESRVGAIVESARLPPYGPGSILSRCHMCVEFVLGSLLALRVYLRVLQFFSLSRNWILNWLHIKFD